MLGILGVILLQRYKSGKKYSLYSTSILNWKQQIWDNKRVLVVR